MPLGVVWVFRVMGMAVGAVAGVVVSGSYRSSAHPGIGETLPRRFRRRSPKRLRGRPAPPLPPIDGAGAAGWGGGLGRGRGGVWGGGRAKPLLPIDGAGAAAGQTRPQPLPSAWPCAPNTPCPHAPLLPSNANP